MSDMKTEALKLAKRGFAVIPIRPGQKTPLIDDWLNMASSDEFMIEEWWEEWPDANVAIVPGRSDPPLVVVDLDNKDGAEEAFEWLRGEWLVPDTLWVQTPNDGYHHYYRVPPDIDPDLPNTAGKLGVGIDTRGGRGYVLAPPSKVDGKPYLAAQTLDPRNAVMAPDGLIERIRKGKSNHERADNADELADGLTEDDLDSSQAVTRARAYIDRLPDTAEGERNDTGFKVAAHLRDLGLSEPTAWDFIEIWNREHCSPPMDTDEIDLLTWSAYHGNAQNPAGAKTPAAAFKSVEVKSTTRLPDDDEEWPTWTIPELKAEPAPRWLIDQTIVSSSVVLIYGQWGAKKTFVVLSKTLALAAGRDWAGKTASGPLKVVYATNEGRLGLVKRVEAWEAHHETKLEPERFIVTEIPRLIDTDETERFLRRMDELNPDVLVLDTLSYAMVGGDENSSSDAAAFMVGVMRVRDRLSATVMLVHHTGKDQAKGARGSAEFSQKADTIFSVSPGLGGSVSVAMMKQKDAEAWDDPVLMRALPVADSIVMVHDDKVQAAADSRKHNKARGRIDREEEAWLLITAAVYVLGGWPADMAIGPTKLAESVLKHLDRDVANKDEVKSVAQMLSRTALAKSDVLDQLARGRNASGQANLFRGWGDPDNGVPEKDLNAVVEDEYHATMSPLREADTGLRIEAEMGAKRGPLEGEE